MSVSCLLAGFAAGCDGSSLSVSDSASLAPSVHIGFS